MKNIERGEQGHHIMIKGSIQQEKITTINIHVPNAKASNYVKKKLMDLKQNYTPIQ